MARFNRLFKKVLELKPVGFWPGFIIGLFYFGWIFWWFWSLYSFDIFGSETKAVWAFFLFFIYAISVAGTAIFWGGASFLGLALLKTRPKIYFVPFYFASIFVLAEYLRSLFFGVLWFGEGATFGPHWTLGNPAYLLSGIKFVSNTASLWGILGISFIILFFSVSLIIFVTWLRSRINKQRPKNSGGEYLVLIVICAVIISILYVSFLFSRKSNLIFSENKIAVSIVQTEKVTKGNYSSDEFLEDFNQKLKLLESLPEESKKKGSYVIFPEGSDFSAGLSSFLDSSGLKDYFNRLSKESIFIVDNNRVETNNGFKSRTIVTNSSSGITDIYEKRLLTMGGEYLPYIIKMPLSFFSPASKEYFANTRQFVKGENLNTLTVGNRQVNIAVCSDLISPDISKSGEANFIIAMNSFGVFGGDKNISRQFLSMSRMRAIENGKYLVLASNFGSSYVVSPSGNVEESTDSTGYQILTGSVVPNSSYTWYNKLGDWPILLVSLLIFGLGLKIFRNANQNKNFL